MKKSSREKENCDLVVELGRQYDALCILADPDPNAMNDLAFRYRLLGMPVRAGEIDRKVRLLTDHRKSVPSDVIITSVDPNLANGGSHEKGIPTLSVCTVRRILSDCLCAGG
jgi:hypothetical protein